MRGSSPTRDLPFIAHLLFISPPLPPPLSLVSASLCVSREELFLGYWRRRYCSSTTTPTTTRAENKIPFLGILYYHLLVGSLLSKFDFFSSCWFGFGQFRSPSASPRKWMMSSLSLSGGWTHPGVSLPLPTSLKLLSPTPISCWIFVS